MPADGLDDAVQLIVGGRVVAAHREHEVDGIKQARQGLGEVGRLIRLQRVLQSLLWAAHTHTQIDTEIYTTVDIYRQEMLKKTFFGNIVMVAEQIETFTGLFSRPQGAIRSENSSTLL